MTTTRFSMEILMLSSILLQAVSAEELQTETNQTIQQPISITTVRGIMGENNPIEHATGQLRMGYITFHEEDSSHSSAYGIGGHYHFDTKRWNSIKIGFSAYTVLNLGINQNNIHLNPDFFNADKESFIQLTEAYLDGEWGKTKIKFGRQILDTPHADSDDIRMIPNYFEAYTIRNTDIDHLILTAGFINRMAGWENGVDAAQFVKIHDVLGTSENLDGIYYTSAVYDGFENLSLSLWYYNYHNIANIIYTEAGYEYAFPNNIILTLGLQYDQSNETGTALLGKQNARTWGISAELASESTGIHLLTAYNQDNGNSAMGLSLGGGPFFTSMEDQTLDAIGSRGKAWMIGTGYHFDKLGIAGLAAGIAYGYFTADDTSLYKSNELDLLIEYNLNNTLTFTAAYASIHFDAGIDENNDPLRDYKQFRLMANYSF